MAEGKRRDISGEDEKDTADVPLSAEETKLMKQYEAGKEVEEKIETEAMHIDESEKYAWYKENTYDIHPELGLVWKDYTQISRQRKIVFNLLKQIGVNLMKGRSIMTVSLPVTIMEPMTMLQRLANVFAYLPAYSERLMVEDPLEKMKRYIGFSIACLHVSLQQKKPFNPVWGETFEGYLGNENCKVYCEQTTHHPPVSNIMIDCPAVTLYATHRVEARTYPNSIKVASLGRQRLIFKDSKRTEYVVKRNPEANIGGLVIGKRQVKYENVLILKDKTNGLYVQAQFNPDKQGFFERVFSKTVAKRSDFFKGFITRNKALAHDFTRKAFYSKDMLSYFEGHWLEYVLIDGEIYWQLGNELPAKLISRPDHLESDSCCRPDLQALMTGDEKTAQIKKDELEDIQRRDRKLREPFDKARKK